MQKTRKFSKSTLAVLALSIVLAVSLIVGATFAWFTDWKQQDDSQAITFGMVDLNVDGALNIEADGGESGLDFSHVLPGDAIDTTGSISSSSNVETYVYITTDATFLYDLDGEGANPAVPTDIYYWNGTTYVSAITVTDLAGTAPTGWTQQTEVTGISDGQLLYLVAAGSTNIYSFSSTTTVAQAMPNYVLIVARDTDAPLERSESETLINGSTGYTITVTLTARAVQSKGMADADAAYTYLTTAGNFANTDQTYPD